MHAWLAGRKVTISISTSEIFASGFYTNMPMRTSVRVSVRVVCMDMHNKHEMILKFVFKIGATLFSIKTQQKTIAAL